MYRLILLLLLFQYARAYIIMGYYTAESAYTGYRIQDVPVRSLTHLTYAFGSVSATGAVTIGDEWASIRMDPNNDKLAISPICPTAVGGNIAELWRLKNMFPHLRTIFAIGGWGDNITASFQAASSTNESRKLFVESSVKIMLDYGFDGIDIDWEFPYGVGDNEQFFWLLRDLRAKLDSLNTGNPYLLTISAAMVPKIIEGMRWKDILPLLTWVNVMSYDYSVDLNQTYHDSPLYPSKQFPLDDGRSIETTINAYFAQGVPASKLLLGLPLYGQKYENVQVGDQLLQSITIVEGQPKQQPIAYRDIIAQKDSLPGNWVEYKDESSKTLWLYSPYSKTLISYTDIQYALPERIKFLKSKGLVGVMFWQLRMDTVNPGGSFIGKTTAALNGRANPSYKKWPTCAPLSSVCSIQSKCTSTDYAGVDSSAERSVVEGLFVIFLPSLALILY